jgi:HK97 family phage portal protein
LYANKAISIRAQKVGQIQFILEKERSGEPVEWNEWLQLLDKPNPYQSGDQFWALAQKYYDVVGACYILKVKDNVPFPGPKPTELRLLRADLVDVLLSPDGTQVLGFQYTANNTTTIYTTEEVIYHYRPDPRNPLLGESLLASALRAIETEYEISQYQTNVLKNGGRLETVLKVDGITTPETIDRTLKQYQEKYAGAKNAGRPLVLGTDMSLEQQGLTPMELAYADTKLATLNDIVIATGVPKVMLGVGSQETFANADAEIASFLRDRIKPELQSWTTTLNWRLIPDEFHLTFEDPTPEDTERRNATIKVQSDIGALTTNEKREMYGMDPIDGGDAILIPMNMVPLQTEKPTPTPAPAEEKSVKWTHPLKDARVRKMYGKGVDSRARMLEKMFEERVNTFFEGQQERVMTAMGKKRKIHKDLVGDIFNRELEVSLAKTALLAAIREVYVTEGNATAATYNTTFTLNSSVEENIRHRAELLTDSIINTTADQLALRITDNIEVGGNRQDLIASIQELYGDISEGRAGVIARTEVHAGMQDAHAHVYQEAGFPTKIWTTVGDSDVREEHAEMDGEEVPLHGVFSNSEYSPSSPNCRCTI